MEYYNARDTMLSLTNRPSPQRVACRARSVDERWTMNAPPRAIPQRLLSPARSRMTDVTQISEFRFWFISTHLPVDNLAVCVANNMQRRVTDRIRVVSAVRVSFRLGGNKLLQLSRILYFVVYEICCLKLSKQHWGQLSWCRTYLRS